MGNDSVCGPSSASQGVLQTVWNEVKDFLDGDSLAQMQQRDCEQMSVVAARHAIKHEESNEFSLAWLGPAPLVARLAWLAAPGVALTVGVGIALKGAVELAHRAEPRQLDQLVNPNFDPSDPHPQAIPVAPRRDDDLGAVAVAESTGGPVEAAGVNSNAAKAQATEAEGDPGKEPDAWPGPSNDQLAAIGEAEADNAELARIVKSNIAEETAALSASLASTAELDRVQLQALRDRAVNAQANLNTTLNLAPDHINDESELQRLATGLRETAFEAQVQAQVRLSLLPKTVSPQLQAKELADLEKVVKLQPSFETVRHAIHSAATALLESDSPATREVAKRVMLSAHEWLYGMRGGGQYRSKPEPSLELDEETKETLRKAIDWRAVPAADITELTLAMMGGIPDDVRREAEKATLGRELSGIERILGPAPAWREFEQKAGRPQTTLARLIDLFADVSSRHR